MAAMWEVLVGVLVGGVISVGTTALADRRREQFAAKRERAEAVRRGMVAARVVQGELLEAVSGIETEIAAKTVWAQSEHVLPTAAWTECRQLLAEALTNHEWLGVSVACAEVGRVNIAVARSEREPHGLDWSTEWETYLSGSVRTIIDGINRLRRLAQENG